MAFDGFTTAALAKELSDKLTGGRIYKIIQPESDELLLTIRPEVSRGGSQIRLVLSADASLPLVYLTDENRPAPKTAPSFCMLLRKHLQNGKIISISQPGLERILRFEVEHYNEMGDLCHHVLVIELMGKHSNILLLAPAAASFSLPLPKAGSSVTFPDQEVIVDAIKHVSSMMSSVREVLPGRPYFVPETQNKTNPFEETKEHFGALLSNEHTSAPKFLLSHFTGFSTRMSEEVVFRAHLSQDRSVCDLSAAEKEHFFFVFSSLLSDVQNGVFSPAIYYHVGAADTLSQGEPVDFSAIPLTMFRDLPKKDYASISLLISSFYREKNAVTRIRQKSADLRKIVQTILERDLHKYDLQKKQLEDTKKRDIFRLYGELLNTYGYDIPKGAIKAELLNYYSGETILVPLDAQKSPQENAQHYFERYTKLKRTEEALSGLMKDVKAEIDQLENIRAALDLSVTEGDLAQIKKEMEDSGFLHRSVQTKKDKTGKGACASTSPAKLSQSKPLHYISSDGYDIYVGKNNLQNDELTFHFSRPTDIWFHANDMPGSHVILRTNGQGLEEVPDRAFEEAARLAAYYSRGRESARVEVDYLERRNVKKPSGARPGFVVYYTNYSINVDADITGIRDVDQI